MVSGFNDCAFEGTASFGLGDRRRNLMGARPVETVIYPDTHDESESDELDVVSVNLNRYGVGLDLSQELSVGTVYSIAIGIGDQKLQSHVRITSCDVISDGLYRASGEFC